MTKSLQKGVLKLENKSCGQALQEDINTDKKQILASGEYQLLTTTYKFPNINKDDKYNHIVTELEIKIYTPDDNGTKIEIIIYVTSGKCL